MRKTVLPLVAIIVLSSSVGFGIAQYNPKVIYEPVPYLEYHYITKTVEIEKIVEVEVERIVEVPIELRQFESPDELKAYLSSFICLVTEKDKCVPQALAFQKRAFDSGYLVNVELISWRDYNYIFKKMYLRSNTNHAICSTIIGNQIWLIEPATNEAVAPYIVGSELYYGER